MTGRASRSSPAKTRKTYSFRVVDDGVNEPSESFQVVLQYSGRPDDINVGSPGNGTITNTETLEASFENMPASHDGSRFSFNLAFTADVGISTQHMRDWAFKMRNGSITRAQRVDGRRDYWKLTVNPGGLEHSGVDDVTITVKGNRNCKAVGAICTKEQHPAQLTNSPSATVVYSTEPSTPTLSITGASGTEGTDSSITFTVTLDEAATDTVTVDYATSDGTADAGDDYTSTTGTLTFDAGTTSKTISVSIADDTDDESDETFTVTLSNTSGADLGTATATGTIRNRTVVVETTPTVSIAGGSGTEGDDDEIDFTVTLDEGRQRERQRRLRDGRRQRRRRRRLHRQERHAELLRRGNQQDDLRLDRGRHRERERRDLHRHALEPVGRRPRYQLGHRHDQEPLRGPADGPLREHAVRARRERVHLRPPLQREPRGQLQDAQEPRVHRRRRRRHPRPAQEPAVGGEEQGLDDHRRARRKRHDQPDAA